MDKFPENEFSEKRQIGVIVQELEQAYPELVITDADGYKTVDYPKLTAVLIEAVKSQREQISNNESRIERLEGLLDIKQNAKAAFRE